MFWKGIQSIQSFTYFTFYSLCFSTHKYKLISVWFPFFGNEKSYSNPLQSTVKHKTHSIYKYLTKRMIMVFNLYKQRNINQYFLYWICSIVQKQPCRSHRDVLEIHTKIFRCALNQGKEQGCQRQRKAKRERSWTEHCLDGDVTIWQRQNLLLTCNKFSYFQIILFYYDL